MKHAGVILRWLVNRFRQVWPNVKITFRGDSAFARKRILHWCERNNITYIVGLSGNSRLYKMIEALEKEAEQQFKETQTKQHLFFNGQYQAGTWSTARRVIGKIEYHEQGSNRRFIVTNQQENVYDQAYCLRGDMENKIKQLKLGLSSDRNSCSDFLANQCRVLLSSIAYILMTELQYQGLSETEL